MPAYKRVLVGCSLVGFCAVALSPSMVRGEPARGVEPMHTPSLRPTQRREPLYVSGTLFATYAKIPLVEGHGSYFSKSIVLQDPLTQKEFEHSEAMLEILDSSMNSSLSSCSNLAAAWGTDPNISKTKPTVCSETDYLVKVWPSGQNQSKSYACYCVSKDDYRSKGQPAEQIKKFPKPVKGQNLALVPMSESFTAYRPDGSWVEPSRLADVYAQDLGPGPVHVNTGTRMRYMRFYTKNARGQFVPLSTSQDAIYRVVDSGLVSSDIPATALVRREALIRVDGSKVPVTRVSSDMWFRPKVIAESGDFFLGRVMQTGSNAEQATLNNSEYSMPIDLNEQHFGLMSRMRSPDKRLNYHVARVGAASSSEQVIHTENRTRPPHSDRISAALPIVDDLGTAKKVGYYTHTYSDNYVWGRPHVIYNLQEAGRRLANKGMVMGIGDINRKPNPTKRNEDPPSYAPTPGHSSHNRGLAVDLRVMSSSGVAIQGTYNDPRYDADKTFEMIKALIDVDPSGVEEIRFNDQKVLERIKNYLRLKNITGINLKSDQRGCKQMHHNHIHFAWKP